jgi:hypothetical protein
MSSATSRPFLDRLSRYFSKRPPSGHLLLWLLRGIFGAICIGIAMLAFRHFSEGPGDAANGYLAFLCILGAGVLIVVTDVLIRNKQITTLSAVYFGLLLGLLLGNILSTALEPFIFDWGTLRPSTGVAPHLIVHPDKEGTIRVDVSQGDGGSNAQEIRSQYERKALSLIITVICCYLAISTLLQTKDEFRFIIPYVEFSKQIKGAKPLVLDTSVIIDGRIADICDTRFIDTKLIVPRFVLQELQSVADS